MSEQPVQATRDDLARGALEHYERLSRECRDYYGLIPKCIEAWKILPELDARIAKLEQENTQLRDDKSNNVLLITKLRSVVAGKDQTISEMAIEIAQLQLELARLCEVEKELTKEKKLSDALYLLLVDNPSTKKLADKIIRTVNRRKE